MYTSVRNWVTGEFGRVIGLARRGSRQYVQVWTDAGRAPMWWPLLECELADEIGGAA